MQKGHLHQLRSDLVMGDATDVCHSGPGRVINAFTPPRRSGSIARDPVVDGLRVPFGHRKNFCVNLSWRTFRPLALIEN
jgi:hypothetical protein